MCNHLHTLRYQACSSLLTWKNPKPKQQPPPLASHIKVDLCIEVFFWMLPQWVRNNTREAFEPKAIIPVSHKSLSKMIHRTKVSNIFTQLHNYHVSSKLSTGKLSHSNDSIRVQTSPPENSNLPSSSFYVEVKCRF